MDCPECGQNVAITAVSELRVHHVGTRTRTPRVIATRQRRLPRLLREMAAEAGMTPSAFLVLVLEQHPTNEAASRELGVTRNTLWRWTKRVGLAVQYVDDEVVAP